MVGVHQMRASSLAVGIDPAALSITGSGQAITVIASGVNSSTVAG